VHERVSLPQVIVDVSRMRRELPQPTVRREQRDGGGIETRTL